MDPLELQLLQEKIARSNDEMAFKRLYYFYFSRLYYFARSLVGQPEQAEEIVQDVFTRLWKNRASLDIIQHLSIYLYRSVRNGAMNFLESRREPAPEVIDDKALQYASGYRADDSLLSAEMLQQLTRAIQDIPPKSRLVFKLVKEDGLRHKEVAEILGISVRTVEKQVALAVKYISRAIDVKFSAFK